MRGQLSPVTFVVLLIVFLLIASFYPVIGSFVTSVASDSSIPESGRTIFGLIPAFLAAGFLMSLFAYGQRRE